jgi:hypothetical protein
MTEETKETLNSKNEEKEKENPETQEKDKDSQDNTGEDLEAKNRQLYERAKKAEEKAKQADAEKLMLEKKVKENSKQATGETPNQADLAKTVVALKEYGPDEIDYIFKQAEFLGVDPLEAANHEDTKLFLQAKREQKERSEKVPEPSTKQSASSKDVSEWTNEDIARASQAGDIESIDKFRKWAREQK